MDKENNFRKKWLLISVSAWIFSTLVFYTRSIFLEKKLEKVKSEQIKTCSDLEPRYIDLSGRDGTYVEDKKVKYLFDDTLSNYCLEYLPEDTTLSLKCVCTCEEYKKNK